MLGCVFRFALECNLALPADNLFRVLVENKPAFCSFISKKGNKLLSFNFEDYRWLNKENLEKKEYEIIRIVGNRVDGAEVPFRYFYTKKDGDAFSAGVKDDMTYSICEVLFNIPSIYYVESQNNLEELQRWVLKVITEFCDVYRLITGDMTFTRSCVADSPIVDVLISDTPIDFINCRGVAPFKSRLRSMVWTDPNKTGHAKMELPKDIVEQIHSFLALGQNLDVYHRLMLDAKEQAILRDNHDLSVILVENAFEVFLQSWLIHLCEVSGVQKLPVGKKKDMEKSYREAIITGNVREDLLHSYVKILTGTNPAGGRLYNKWYEHAYSLRNEIIHRGKYETTSQQSFNAYKAAMEFMLYLEGLLSTG